MDPRKRERPPRPRRPQHRSGRLTNAGLIPEPEHIRESILIDLDSYDVMEVTE
jgi:hypothetical protein